LMRLAIGWHFLFEGLHKVHSTYTDRPFSSAGYFREAEGPLGSWMRRHVGGDPDAAALERLTRAPGRPNAPPHDPPPPALARDWQAYLDRFVQFHQLGDTQKAEAQTRLQQSEDNTALWLMGLRKEPKEEADKEEPERFGLKVPVTLPAATVAVWRTI